MTVDRLTLAEAAVIIQGSVKDKSYRATPLGQLVGRYVRWFRNEWGATPMTLKDYESVLSKMALALAHRDPLEVDVEDLRYVIDHGWSDTSARTRAKVTSIIRAFWSWAEDQSYVPSSPAAKLRRPRAPKKRPGQLPRDADLSLLAATSEPRDRVALACLLWLGLRRGELAGLQMRHFDLARREVIVMGKGQKQRVLPLRGEIVLEIDHYLLADLPHVGRPPEPDDFLLYPTKLLFSGRTAEGKPVRARKGFPKQPPSGPCVHRWWYECLSNAGLVGAGVTAGMNMHRARHTFAQDVRRAHRDIGTVQQLLGHADSSTTIDLYGGYAQEDLEQAMEDFAKSKRPGVSPEND